MFLKFSSILVSEYRVCRTLGLKNLLIISQIRSFLSHPYFTLSLKQHIKGSIIVVQRGLKMSANVSQDLFQGKEDRFQGITVFSDLEPCELEVFEKKLLNSLTSWNQSHKRGIWFKVHLNQTDWVPILVKNGFKYHHAKEDYVMLYRWLPNSESDNIPNYAHTMVGVGAVVVNQKDQVLVVREKYFYKKPMWKLPGGYVEPGENIVDAAIREVSEETGIRTQFESLLTLRQTHHGMFGCSDIYVVVNLKALTTEIEKCEREIAECQWMDIEEYLEHPHVHELNRFFVHKLKHHKRHNLKMDCHHGIHQLLQKPFTVYSISKMDEEASETSNNFSFLNECNKK